MKSRSNSSQSALLKRIDIDIRLQESVIEGMELQSQQEKGVSSSSVSGMTVDRDDHIHGIAKLSTGEEIQIHRTQIERLERDLAQLCQQDEGLYDCKRLDCNWLPGLPKSEPWEGLGEMPIKLLDERTREAVVSILLARNLQRIVKIENSPEGSGLEGCATIWRGNGDTGSSATQSTAWE